MPTQQVRFLTVMIRPVSWLPKSYRLEIARRLGEKRFAAMVAENKARRLWRLAQIGWEECSIRNFHIDPKTLSGLRGWRRHVGVAFHGRHGEVVLTIETPY